MKSKKLFESPQQKKYYDFNKFNFIGFTRSIFEVVKNTSVLVVTPDN